MTVFKVQKCKLQKCKITWGLELSHFHLLSTEVGVLLGARVTTIDLFILTDRVAVYSYNIHSYNRQKFNFLEINF